MLCSSGARSFDTRRGQDLVLDRSFARKNPETKSYFPSEEDFMQRMTPPNSGFEDWTYREMSPESRRKRFVGQSMGLENRGKRAQSIQSSEFRDPEFSNLYQDANSKSIRGQTRSLTRSQDSSSQNQHQDQSSSSLMNEILSNRESVDRDEILGKLKKLNPAAFGSIQSFEDLGILAQSARASLDGAKVTPNNNSNLRTTLEEIEEAIEKLHT